MSISFQDILSAQSRVRGYLNVTPLARCEQLEKALGFKGRVFLKDETVQPTGSFKVRGAFNALLSLSEEERSRGVVTRSSGNFAQAVAYAAKTLGIAATIVMPTNAPKVKLEGTKQYNPTILFSGPSHEEGEKIVAQLAEEKGLVRLHAYNNNNTIAGQGTAGLEIFDQLPTIEHFFCPIGGGGLMGGCARALKHRKPGVVTHGIEPAGANDYSLSRHKGIRVTLDKIDTIADGLRASAVGDKNYPLLNEYVDEVTEVTDEEIKASMAWLLEYMKMVVEPSGAVSLAGFMQHHASLKGDVVILISGKNYA